MTFKNETKEEKALWQVNNTTSNKMFLKRLSKWIFKYYGNVNVAQRLNIININKP